MMHATLEAVCRKCGESYSPLSEKKVVHTHRDDGQKCGGHPIRLHEVHTNQKWFKEALLERAMNPNRKWPLLKLRKPALVVHGSVTGRFRPNNSPLEFPRRPLFDTLPMSALRYSDGKPDLKPLAESVWDAFYDSPPLPPAQEPKGSWRKKTPIRDWLYMIFLGKLRD